MGHRGIWSSALLAVALAACGGTVTAVDEDQLEGRWDWRSASGGIAGRTITPASEGYTMQLRFARAEVALYRNGTLQASAGYRLAIGGADGSFAGRDVVRFSPAIFGWDEMGVQITVEGELVLADGCCDGFTYRFVRASAGS